MLDVLLDASKVSWRLQTGNLQTSLPSSLRGLTGIFDIFKFCLRTEALWLRLMLSQVGGGDEHLWRSLGESNPCFSLERAAS